MPLRYKFLRFGGSWTQRQVFSVTVIQAAVKANKVSLAVALVAELKVTLLWSLNDRVKVNNIPLSPSILLWWFFLQAQKPKNMRLEQLFNDLKLKYESKDKSHPISPKEPAPKRRRMLS